MTQTRGSMLVLLSHDWWKTPRNDFVFNEVLMEPNNRNWKNYISILEVSNCSEFFVTLVLSWRMTGALIPLAGTPPSVWWQYGHDPIIMANSMLVTWLWFQISSSFQTKSRTVRVFCCAWEQN